MYSIIHIPTGLLLTEIAFNRSEEVQDFYEGLPLHGTTDFYSLQDSKRFVKNFVEYDKFQRRKPQTRSDYCWLIRNNRFPFLQYRILVAALCLTTACDPAPDPLILDEFLITKTRRNGREWKRYQSPENLGP